MVKYLFILFFILQPLVLLSKSIITIYPDSIADKKNSKLSPGFFYNPQTGEEHLKFLNGNIHYNSLRINIIGRALNNTSNLNECLEYLTRLIPAVKPLSEKADKLIFLIERMPIWLSNSQDTSDADIPGWKVFNTKAPKDWNKWNSVVKAIIKLIFIKFEIKNAYFEIWNEPAIGSWTDSKTNYFKLFRNTFEAIKSVDESIPVGGPASNFWAKNFNYNPPYGYLRFQYADSSLIGELIDSTISWGINLDFISWHNFNLAYKTYANAADFIKQKYAGISSIIPELLVSEWNAPSYVRETALQKTFFIKTQKELPETPVTSNMIAAWQDFNEDSKEFHKDYGLITYGGICKPACYAIILSEKMTGYSVKHYTNAAVDVITTKQNDTLNILVSNYIPPPFFEAFNHTLFEGKLNILELDSAGFIDFENNDYSYLYNIYKGIDTVTSDNPIAIAVNNSIPVFRHYDSLQNKIREFEIIIESDTGIINGFSITIDSVNNNNQLKYDSLINAGYDRNEAVNFIVDKQTLTKEKVVLAGGKISFSMQSNAIIFFQFALNEITEI